MSQAANYKELSTVPTLTKPRWTGEGNNKKLENDADPYKWSGTIDPPAIGARVKCYMNNLGYGTVVGYFVEYGWFGVLVQLSKNPKWRREQCNGNPPAHMFGIDLEPWRK